MKYRVEIDVSFANESDALSLLNHLETLKHSAYEPDAENDGITTYRTTRAHQCYHDENPPSACGNYTNVDFDESGSETHTEIPA
jgi:hypothetical protein